MTALIPLALQKLQQAALAPETWPQACALAGEALGGVSFALIRIDAEGPRMIAPPQLERHLENYLAGEWWARDLRGARAFMATPMTLIGDNDLVDPAERASSEFYRGFAADEDVPHSLGWGMSEGDCRLFFTTMRSASLGPANDDDRAALRTFMPVASAAAQISYALSQSKHAGLLQGLEATGEKVIGLDRSGRIVAHTHGAEPLLSRFFALEADKLSAAQKPAAAALAHLRDLLRHQRADDVPKSFVLADGHGGDVLCQPLMTFEAGDDVFTDIAALLLLRDLGASTAKAPAPALLQHLFALTPGEADVALAIGAGDSISDISRQRGVTPATTRTLLSSVFRKTGVHRQGELAALIARLS